MVVISASIINKQGKILLARQFLEISRIQLESLLGKFPKLIEKEKQTTYVEVEDVRYVYLPIDQFYLVLITNLTSNILEDLETLRMLQKIVQHYCPYNVDSVHILKSSFEIILGFDDVISQGYREAITLNQVIQYAEMDSQEEKIAKQQRQTQEQEAKEIAKRKQAEIAKQRAQQAAQEAARQQQMKVEQQQFENLYAPEPVVQEEKQEAQVIESQGAPKKSTTRKGMSLGKKKQSEVAPDF